MDVDKLVNLGFAVAIATYLLVVELPRARSEFSKSLEKLGGHLDGVKQSVDEAVKVWKSK